MVEVDVVEDVVDVEVDVVAAALVVVAGVEMASAVRSVRCPGEPRRYRASSPTIEDRLIQVDATPDDET